MKRNPPALAKGETFEDNIESINLEISKRKSSWTLTALAWIDYDDISQILRIHIHKKWHLFDKQKPLAPWINTIISHQIRNLIRNNYGNYSRPCLKCAAQEGEDLCAIYEKQCSRCPLFTAWEKTKKRAHDIKLPLPLENHSQEVFNMQCDSLDIERTSKNIHAHMIRILKPIEAKIYRLLYLENKSETDVAKTMGYKTNEKGRSPGYKQLKNIKKSIILKVRKAIYNGDVDIIN